MKENYNKIAGIFCRREKKEREKIVNNRTIDRIIGRTMDKTMDRRIDRKHLVGRYNPKMTGVNIASPLTVGNGEFAFTADITGFQSLYEQYCNTDEGGCPLCTMAQWGWHTKPVSETKKEYTLDDLEMTTFDYQGRTVKYPKDCKPGNEEVYHWLRQNPHRLNLGRIGLLYQDREIQETELTGIFQELDLYEGRLKSRYDLDRCLCETEVCCDSQSDTLAFRLKSPLVGERKLSVCLTFPYGSPDITASDWNHPEMHTTRLIRQTEQEIRLRRTLDDDEYFVTIKGAAGCWEADDTGIDRHCLKLYGTKDVLEFTVSFQKAEGQDAVNPEMADWDTADQNTPDQDMPDCGTVFDNSRNYWKDFWEKGGMVQFGGAPDQRKEELQRRIILSLYLMAVNSSGSMPPQETGLTCNSWYGKMHLEMHFWHSAWAPLWNHPELLERSMPWYIKHLKEARRNAAVNGFKGARWPKMVAETCIDSPSGIAPMLIWQQPHILFLLELLYRCHPEQEFLEKYWEVVQETAEFMADFAVYDEKDGKYDLLPPVIPVQECHDARDAKNPAFEVEYWRYGLALAVQWAKRLGRTPDPAWIKVSENMREVRQKDGAYLAHENCEDTFTRFQIDHPSMLGMYGVLPSDRIDPAVMERTLDRVIRVWDYESLWGWDFAVMSMTAARLGKAELAADCLLMDTPKNQYVGSGNNSQRPRTDLPLYLPGNGSLLLAAAFLAAGNGAADGGRPGTSSGFPDSWNVICENMNAYV